MKANVKRWVAAVCAVASLVCAAPMRGAAQDGPKGRVAGYVYNTQSGDVVRGASVEVVGSGETVRTGVDGDYALELPAGTYEVKFTLDQFTAHAETVVVKPGDTTELSTALVPVGAGESVDVVASADNENIEAVYENRKASTSISDVIGRQQIKQDTRSTLAGVIVRVPGVTVKDDGNVVLRGMDPRYSQQQLNGATLATPDPERKQVSLELIPAKLLQSASVAKSFTPDLPGEFSGGLVRLETIEMPSATTLSMSYELGFNSVTTGKDFLTSGGGGADFFGFGAGQRAIPALIPAGVRLEPSNPFTPGGFSREQLQEIGRSFDNTFTPETASARPTQSFNLSGGRRIGRLGLVGAVAFKNDLESRHEARNFYTVDATGDLTRQTSYDYAVSEEVARLGLSANVTYEITGNHKLYFKNYYSNQSGNEARVFQGFNDDRATDLRNTRLDYKQEGLYSGQLAGRHSLDRLWSDLTLNWRYTYGRSTLDEPDLREALYEFNPTVGDFVYLPQNQSLFHLFNDMVENMREPAVDVQKFWLANGVSVVAKVGANYINRDRTFDSRRFIFQPRGNVSAIDLTAAPEVLLARDNIRPVDGFEVTEETRSTDHYDALQNITAGYAMADVNWGHWRFVGGARAERSIQRVNTFEPFRTSVAAITANLDDTDVLPSLGAVYTINPGAGANQMAVRASYGKTVSRPQFRELSPFEFTDVTGGRASVGNPDLVRTRIDNYDVRFELYPQQGELVAVSYFFKKLRDPIETVVEPGANLVSTFENADSARNQGLELELRKNLGFVNDTLRAATIYANYTYVASRVTLTPEQGLVVTSLDRPLVGQSKNIFNLILSHEVQSWSFESRALFNYTGDRITDVGTLGLPDIVEHGRPTLDLQFVKKLGGERKPWAVQIELENVLNRPFDTRQGDQPFRVYRAGREVSVGVSYNFF